MSRASSFIRICAPSFCRTDRSHVDTWEILKNSRAAFWRLTLSRLIANRSVIRIAVIVAETLHHFDQLDQRRYRLDAFCMMSNHIHVVLMPLPTTEPAIEAHINGKLVKDREGNIGYLDQDRQFVPVTFHSLASIMHSVKRQTANECNKLLNRTGSFWEPESYDRYARDQEEWRRMVTHAE